jgi:hypothetical protein
MSEPQLAAAELQALARRLGIDRPVVAWRLLNNAVELTLLGGQTVRAARAYPAGDAAGQDELESLSLARLRRLAHERGVRRAGRLTRAELLQALS